MRAAFIAFSVLAGCGQVSSNIDAPTGGSDTGNNPDTAVDTPASGVHQAFVGNYNNGGGGNIGVYTALPLTATSTPDFTLGTAAGLSGPGSLRLAPNGQRLWVADSNGKVFAFDLPLTATSVPVVTLTAAAQPTDLQFDPNGNLWVSEFGGKVEEWTVGNMTGASAKTLTAGTGNLFSLAIDSTTGNLYTAGGSLYMFTTPGTATNPAITLSNWGGSISGMTAAAGKLYCGSYANGLLGYYNLPLNANSAPNTLIASGVFAWKIGFNAAGDMTVPVGQSGGQNKVNVYSAPAFTTLAFAITNLNDPRALTYGP